MLAQIANSSALAIHQKPLTGAAMGMFDQVTFRHRMPDGYPGDEAYQTKDLRFNMDMASYVVDPCLLYTSPSPRDRQKSRMPSSA